jgi:hypothetical protein
MNRRRLLRVLPIAAIGSAIPHGALHFGPIDCDALVTGHNVAIAKSGPLQVGNGVFAFGADITGKGVWARAAGRAEPCDLTMRMQLLNQQHSKSRGVRIELSLPHVVAGGIA